MKNILVFLAVVLIVFTYACSKESISSNIEEQTNLYPLEIGKYWVYTSDSIVYSQAGLTRDTFNSLIKEEITDFNLTASGDSSYVITRSFKRSLDSPWEVSDIWTASRSGNLITKTEENLKFVKLDLPLVENKVWDGNKFFDEFIDVNIGPDNLEAYKNWESKVLSLNETLTVHGVTYTDVVKIELVNQVDEYLNYRDVVEYYAPNVGLIQKNLYILDSQTADLNDWINTAEKGVILTLRLLEHN